MHCLKGDGDGSGGESEAEAGRGRAEVSLFCSVGKWITDSFEDFGALLLVGEEMTREEFLVR